MSIGDGVADESALAPELLLHNTEIEAWVRQWLDELNERQRTVIERRYGLNGRDVATLEELARRARRHARARAPDPGARRWRSSARGSSAAGSTATRCSEACRRAQP